MQSAVDLNGRRPLQPKLLADAPAFAWMGPRCLSFSVPAVGADAGAAWR